MSTLVRTIKELEIVQGARIFVAPRKTKDVVTLEGSVIGGASLVSEYKRMVPAFAANLLDAGTKTKTKDALRESLAARGATLSFCAKGERMHFYGSCLPEDLNLLVKTLVECLGESVFPKEEIETVREIVLGELAEEKSDTKAEAAAALTRAVYDAKHPNYIQTTALRERSVRAIDRKDLVSFAKHLGSGGLVLAVVGDVTIDDATKALQNLKRLPKGTSNVATAPMNAKVQTTSETFVRIAGKANIDTYLGASVPLTVQDSHYVPFMFLSDMLGSRGFSGHLMQTIRERDGLTYGIYTMHTGFDDNRDGLFRIWATFSPDTFARAVTLTRKEIALFFKTKLTEEAVEARKERLIGGYLMSLSTTGGLASALHRIGREGRSLAYLDQYPEILREMTLSQIREAAALIPLTKLSLTASGTFADKA